MSFLKILKVSFSIFLILHFYKMDVCKLWEITKSVFLDEKKFHMKKVITDFTWSDGKFLGDFFSYLIREEVENESPIFYSVVSPYDAIGKTEAYSSSIYRDGNILYSGDFKEYTWIRTWLLSPLIIKTLGQELSEKKVLIVGSWKLAVNGVKAIQQLFQDVSKIFYTSQSWRKEGFEEAAKKENFTLEYKEDVDFSEFDIVFFYTNTKKSILENVSQVKTKAIISSHISSTSYAEYSDEIYKEANVIIDWRGNVSNMKDLERAVSAWFITQDNILSFKDILDGKNFLSERRYLLIRSTGTPMQNVAVLKYLTQDLVVWKKF